MAAWPNWKQALGSGVAFLAVFIPVQWLFADFLMSPGSRNWFFGSGYLNYFQGPNSFQATHRFVPFETASQFQTNMLLAFVVAILSTWLGLAIGDWLKRVRR
jgi:hypothetical protein